MNSWLKKNTKYIGLALLTALSACGEAADDNIPHQKWQNMDVQVETRPSPPEVGMDEILVMVTDERGRPGSDLMVSLRSSDQDRWVQAIEDGGLGVYRRAVELAPGERSMLQVQLKRNGMESVLRFPLKVAGPG
jgi:hypothetical protein